MNLKPKFLALALASVGFVFAGSAFADPLTPLLQETDMPTPMTSVITVDGAPYGENFGGGNVWGAATGKIKLYDATTFDGSNIASLPSFIAFCLQPAVEIDPNMGVSQGELKYLPGDGGGPVSYSTARGITPITPIKQLFNLYYNASGSIEQAAAFQLALWELAYDTASGNGGAVDLTTGAFQLTGIYDAVGVEAPQVATDAAYYLDHLGAVASRNLIFTAWTNATSQNLLSVSADIPEPATGLLAALGLVGFMSRRRALKS